MCCHHTNMKLAQIKMFPLLPDHTAGYRRSCGCVHDRSSVNHELGCRMGALRKWEQHDMVKCRHCRFKLHPNRTSELSLSSFYYHNITINAQHYCGTLQDFCTDSVACTREVSLCCVIMPVLMWPTLSEDIQQPLQPGHVTSMYLVPSGNIKESWIQGRHIHQDCSGGPQGVL